MFSIQKKKWFALILLGEKTQEYREIKQHWISRLILDNSVHHEYSERSLHVYKNYDAVEFKNGYGKNAPTILIELQGFSIGQGKKEWGAEQGEVYFIIHLGKIINTKNL